MAVRGVECERGGVGDRPSLNRFASGKQDLCFEGVQVGSGVRTFEALALLLRSPTSQRELLSQDHPAPPTPPRLYGNRRFVSMMVRVGRRMTKPL